MLFKNVSTAKLGGSTTDILNCYFSKKNLHFALVRQINCLHMENYSNDLRVFIWSLRKTKKTHTGESILQAFLLLPEKKRLINL